MHRISHTLFFRILPLSFFLVGAVGASDEQFSASSEGLHLGGYSFWQFGQIVKGDNIGKSIDHQWTNNALLGFTISANPSERLCLLISPEFKINYPFPESQNKPETVRPFGVSYINEAKGVFTFGKYREKPSLELSVGVFTHKYNPHATHLGEYLFRTGTYPMYVLTDFDFPCARLIGLRLTSDAIANLHTDLLLTSEAFMYPLYDFSLSGLASYTLFNAIDLGAGVNLARLLPVVSSKTSPEYTQNFLPSGFNEYIKENGDTGFYSFKATKVMVRASIDPKIFLGSPEYFGREDLKIYGEIVCVDPFSGYKALDLPELGYPAYYNDVNRRMPRMFGINIPTFKLLDLLALEFEYFPGMLPDDYFLVEQMLTPMPRIEGGAGSYDPNDYKANTWKWSVYAKREILNGFIVTALLTRDHLRTTYWNGARQSFTCMTQPGHWHWEFKTGFAF
jgi:hypothetical protein